MAVSRSGGGGVASRPLTKKSKNGDGEEAAAAWRRRRHLLPGLVKMTSGYGEIGGAATLSGKTIRRAGRKPSGGDSNMAVTAFWLCWRYRHGSTLPGGIGIAQHALALNFAFSRAAA